jgi:hypothetical protein
LNGLTAQVQYFQIGTSGTDFNIASATATHTFNLPTASAVNRGALSAADWSVFNGKQNAITLTTTGTSGVSTLIGSTLNIPNYSTDLSGYVTLDTTQTITGLKTILRGGDVLNFKIGTDTLYGLKIAYNQNELVPSGEATWSFVNTFNRNGSGFSVTPLSFFRGVLVTGDRLLSASVNTNLLDYYANNPSGRYPIYAYNTGVQQFASSIIVGETNGVVDAITGAIADLPAGVVANFKGRVIGSNAVNSNEFVTLSQISGLGTGTVTSVAALTLGTTGTDLSSTVANSTTTPVITLNVPTASATNRGALSAADWTTFNNKQNALTNPVTGTGTTNYLPKFTGASTIGNSLVFDDGTNVGIGTNTPTSFGAGYTVTSINGSSGGGVLDLMVNNTRFLTLAVDGSEPSISGRVSGLPIVFKTNNGGTVAERMRIFSDGNVFIGTSPSNAGFKLDVNGTGRFSGNLRTDIALQWNGGVGALSNGSGFVTVETNSATQIRLITNSNPALTVDTNQRIGIGTLSPQALLTISGTNQALGGAFNTYGNSLITSNESPAINIGGSISLGGRYFSGNTIIATFGRIHGKKEDASDGATAGYLSFETTADATATLAERMRITSIGNVGIGTASPTSTFDITGASAGGITQTIRNTQAGVGAGSGFRMGNNLAVNRLEIFTLSSTYTTAGAYVSDGSSIINEGTGGLSIGGTNAAGVLRFYTAGTGTANERMRITSGGNVLIGTTTNANFGANRTTIQINGADGSGFLTNYNNTGAFYVFSSSTGTDLVEARNLYMSFATNGSERMRITSGGNVLIGTTTDFGEKFAVSGGRIYANGTGTSSGFTWNNYNIHQDASTNLIYRNGGTEIFRFANSGAATFTSLGTGTVTATAGTLSTVSDSSYKVDDGFIDSAIEKVLSLKPRYFYWNEKSGLPKDIRQLGFYAQEVNEALGEEAANKPKDKNTPWGISDRSMIAMLTKAIQEQQQQIQELKNKLS